MRADTVRDTIGLSVNHAHVPVIDAKGLGADLRHDRFKSLADRRPTGDQLDLSIGIDGRAGAISRAPPAFVEEDAHPDADDLAGFASTDDVLFQRIELNGLQRFLQKARIITGIENLSLHARLIERASERHVLRPNQVSTTDFGSLDAEFSRSHIEQALPHERAFIAARCAIGCGRGLVG